MALKTIDNIEFRNKVVLLRCDLNIPFDSEGNVIDTTRIKRHTATINELVHKGAKILILSHFGRPNGKVIEELSLNKIVPSLAKETKAQEIAMLPNCIGEVVEKVAKDLNPGDIAVLENVRFHKEEEENDLNFAKKLSRGVDIYINDAFSVSHRKHSSVSAITGILPSYAGRSLETEISMLKKITDNIEHPVMAIIGGSKISTKINLLKNLISKVDFLVIGGAMANTFLASKGHSLGKSLVEDKYINIAKEITSLSEKNDCTIILPKDLIVSESLNSKSKTKVVNVNNVPENMAAYDIGPETIEVVSNYMAGSKTLLWNGPLGVFETKPFDLATNTIGRIAVLLTRAGNITSVLGGGDTVAAMNVEEISGGFSFVSVAGGAMLEWLEGKKLPGILPLYE